MSVSDDDVMPARQDQLLSRSRSGAHGSASGAQTGGDIEAMATLLEVSALALRRRMQALAL
jgi:hypothetical protein